MSFVTTHPEALTAAAERLQGIGSAMAARNAAAAAPTTGVVPAAADAVSVLQATQFAAYGNLYQSISAQAQAIHEMFVQALGISAGSYADTEAANQVAAGSSPLSGFLGGLVGSSSSSGGLSGLLGSTGLGGLSGNLANIANVGAGNIASAGSDLLGLASGGLLSNTVGEPGFGELGVGGIAAGLHEAIAASAVGPAGPTGLGVTPALAGVGQASSVGGLSMPPSWAGLAAPASSAAPAMLTGAGWTTAAPHTAPVAAMPAGMPSAASAGRGGLGFGTPRYGVKPTVMPKPAAV